MIDSPTTLQKDELMLISVLINIAYPRVVTQYASSSQDRLPKNEKMARYALLWLPQMG